MKKISITLTLLIVLSAFISANPSKPGNPNAKPFTNDSTYLKFLNDNKSIYDDIFDILSEKFNEVNSNIRDGNIPKDKNIKQEGPKISLNDDPHPPAFQFIYGLLHGLQVFDKVSHRKECLSLLPVLDDDITDIIKKLDNISRETDIIELLKYVVDKIEHIEKKIKSVEGDCKYMLKDVKEVLKNIEQDFIKKQRDIQMIFRHFFSNIGLAIGKIEESKDFLEHKQWYKAGLSTGDLLKFMFIWDFENNLN